MDGQIIELLGRQKLIAELLRANLEVSVPIRDRGIDLVAYADLQDRVSQFSACPIQLKAAMGESFSIDIKYAKFPNLIIAYVWHIENDARTVTYATSYSEALGIAESMGYTKTKSWAHGLYASTKPSTNLLIRLEPFRMTPEKWWSKVTGLAERFGRGQGS
jgi:hypothetical protein